MENYSNEVQKSLGKLINVLSVNDYLTLIEDLINSTSIKGLKKKHRALLSAKDI